MKKPVGKLLVIMLIVVAAFACAMSACGKKNDKPAEGPETGSYYCDADSDNEYRLELSGGKTVKLNMGQELIGEYTVQGSVLNFKFGEQTMTATFGGDSIALSVNSAGGGTQSLMFYRIKDFTVTFDSKGGTKVDAKKVRNGRTAEKPENPTRVGYKFDGWYLGETEYDFDNNRITADITLTAKWTEQLKLDTPEITRIDVSIITWNAVIGADAYKLEINGPKEVEPFVKEVTAPVCNEFKFEIPGIYTVSVTALSKSDPSKNSDAAIKEFRYKVLDAATGFNVAGNKLSWNAVEHAQTYYVTVVCGKNHTVENVDTDGKTEYDFSACGMREEGIDFSVVAKADGYADSEAAKYNYDRRLGEASGFSVDSETETLSWDAVDYATEYVITVGESDPVTITNTQYCLKEFGKGEIKITVVPRADGYNSPKQNTPFAYNKVTLAVPANVRIDGTTLKWSAVTGATGYKVKFGDIVITEDAVTNTEYELMHLEFNSDDTYEFSVMTVGAAESENSIFCTPVVAKYLTFAEAPVYKNGMISWSHVLGAKKYIIIVNDGTPQEIAAGANTASVTLRKGENNIVIAIHDGTQAQPGTTVKETAYQVTYDSQNGSAVAPRYIAWGDKIPVSDKPVYIGYEFDGWYTAAGGAEGTGEKVDANATLAEEKDITLYAGWLNDTYTINLHFGLGSKPEGGSDVHKVVRNSNYTIPMPATDDNALVFVGWFSAPNGSGERYTDENGNSLKPWANRYGGDMYAQFVRLSFKYLPNSKTYSLVQNNIDLTAWNIKVPATYNDGVNGEKAVSVIDGYAFYGWRNLKKVLIPESVIVIEDGTAFAGCDNLNTIEVYEVDGFSGDPVYSSCAGVLIYSNSRTHDIDLKFVPAGITGELDLSGANFTNIPYHAFYFCNADKIILPSTLKAVQSGAFTYCDNLTEVIFEQSTEAGSLVINQTAFNTCAKLSKVTFPARMENFTPLIFAYCNAMETVSVKSAEGIAAKYGVVNGALVELSSRTLVYFPSAKSSFEFKAGDIAAIGEYAFYGANKLKSIIIPAWVTEFGKSAFEYSALESVIFESGNENINISEAMFRDCSALKSISLQGKIVQIGNYAFYNCSALTELVLPDTVTLIGDYAFYRCANITGIEFGNSLETIGSHAFDKCAKLSSVSLPSTLTQVGEYAFYDCAALANVEFAATGSGLSISGYAFANCAALKEFEVPSYAESIASSMFSGCNALSSVTVKEGNTAYKAIENVIYKINEAGDIINIVYYPTNKSGELTIPATMTQIGDNVFADNANITNIVIPATVTKVGNYAFSGCTNLRSVIFEAGEGTIELGDGVFKGCEKLNAVTFSSRVTAISKEMFSGCVLLPYFEITEQITSIGDNAFNGCKGLVEISLEYSAGKSNLKSIGNSSFYQCSAASELIIPASVTSIGADAFAYMSGLTVVVFEDGSESLTVENSSNYGTFYYCAALNSVTLPNRLARIADNMFNYCSSLTAIELTSGLHDVDGTNYAIGKTAFKSCTALISVTIGDFSDKTESFGIASNAFNGCSKLTSVALPKTLSYLDTGAYSSSFSGCRSLWDIQFEGNDKYALYSGVLYNAAKTAVALVPQGISGKVVIPVELKELAGFSGLTKVTEIAFEENEEGFEGDVSVLANLSITDDALGFYNCSQLTTVHLPERLTHIGTYAFYDCKMLSDVTIPKNGKLESIADSAFYNTIALNELALPNKEFTIGSDVFTGSGLNTLIIHSSLQSKLSSLGCNPATVKIYNEQGEAVVPEAIIKYEDVTGGKKLVAYPAGITAKTFEVPVDVVEIADNALFGNTYLETVTFKSGSLLTAVGANAFASCGNLMSVDFTNTKVATIGASAFENCVSLTSVTFPQDCDLQSISSKTFANSGLITIEVPEKVTSIGASAFEGASLETVTFRKQTKDSDGKVSEAYNIAEIGQYAFAATGLKSITVPATVTSMGNYAFAGCVALKTVEFETGEEAVTLGRGLFAAAVSYGYNACTILESVDFGSRLEVAPADLFMGCSNLTAVEGLDNLTSVSSNMFKDCISLRSITIPDGVTTLRTSMFENCMSLETVLGMKNVAEIYGEKSWWSDTITYDSKMFKGCTSLKSFTIPAKLTVIAPEMFADSGLEEITIPASVSEIIPGTSLVENFENCASLKRVIFEFSAAPLTANIRFKGCSLLESVDFGGREVKMFADNISSGDVFEKLTQTIELKNAQKAVFGIYAFRNYPGLAEVTVVANVVETIAEMYEGCVNLRKITFAQSSDALIIADNSFRNLASLVEVDFGGRKVTIGNGAFENCDKLATLSGAENITVIGNSAFKGAAFTSLKLPETLTEIGEKAFMNCALLGSVEFGNKLDKIGNSAFRGTAISSLIFPVSVSELGDYVFADNSSLLSVEISTGNFRSIGEYTFYGCENLSSVEFTGDGAVLSEIGNGVFEGCNKITSVQIPAGVKIIGENAFNGTNLTSVTLPANLNSLGNGAFANNTSLNNVTIPASVSVLSGNPFAGCTSLTNLNVDAGNAIYKLDGSAVYSENGKGLAFVMGSLGGKFDINSEVTSIGVGAFAGSKITEIEITDKFTSVAAHAFSDCTSLSKVTLPEGLLSIGDYAFSGCTALASLTIPSSVTSIGAHAFDGCSQLSAVNLPESLLSAGSHIFADCVALESIEIPSKLFVLPESTFEGCAKLTSVSFADNCVLDTIGNYAFRGTGIKELTLPSTVSVISGRALASMPELTTVNFAAGRTSVKINTTEKVGWSYEFRDEFDGAFRDSDNLTTVNFNGRPAYIGMHAFKDLTKLKNFDFATVRDILPSAFEGCMSLTDVALPANCQIVRNRAFANSGVANLTIANGVLQISSEAFVNTNVVSVAIPDSVTTFEESAFRDCSLLESVTVGKGLALVSMSAFENCTALTSVKFNGITGVAQRAFANCNRIAAIEITAIASSSLGTDAFGGWTENQKIYIPHYASPIVSDTWSKDWSGGATVIWGEHMPTES